MNNIRLVTIEELEEVLTLFKDTVTYMIKLGIDQWDESYPNREIIVQDIKNGYGYCKTINDKIVSYMAINR